MDGGRSTLNVGGSFNLVNPAASKADSSTLPVQEGHIAACSCF